VALVGKSLWRMDDTARHTGYLQTLPEFLTDEDAERIDAEKIVYIVTGSQGEVRAQLARIALDEHPSVYVEEGDVVIFSSRAIPGNERAIERIKNNLYLLGADVLTDREAPIHVSGHPYREEIKLMYKWVKPKYAIPVHGEQMQLEKHADLALECGVEEVVIPQNGDVIQLAPGVPEKCGVVKSGMLALEGTRIVAVDHDAILTRKRMMFNGSAIVTVVLDQKGQMLSRPKLTALGLLDEESAHDQAFLEEASQTVADAIAAVPMHERSDRKALEEVIRIAARRYFSEQFNRKPQTRVHLMIV
jgi:ribonuclease J